MSEVVYNEVIQVGPLQYRLTWVPGPDGTLYHVWFDGVLRSTTYSARYDFSVDVNDSPQIQVFDDPDDRPQAVYPYRATLQWYHVANAIKYRVAKWVAGEWATQEPDPITRRGEYMFEWRSYRIEDGEAYQFRVTPLLVDDTEGDPIDFSGVMVRPPDAPSVSYSVDPGTKKVTVSLDSV